MWQHIFAVKVFRNVVILVAVFGSHEESFSNGSNRNLFGLVVEHVQHQLVLVRLNDDLAIFADVRQTKLDIAQPLSLFILLCGVNREDWRTCSGRKIIMK